MPTTDNTTKPTALRRFWQWLLPPNRPWYINAAALVVVVALPAAIVIDQCGPNKGTGGHPDAWCVPRATLVADVCPSVQHQYDAIKAVYADIGSRGIRTLRVELATCEDPPAPGHVQWRACTDILAPYTMGCPDGYFDTVGFNDQDAGVVYLGSSLAMTHAALHTIGYGHTSAATSIMYGPTKESIGNTGVDYKPGRSWERIKPDACARWMED